MKRFSGILIIILFLQSCEFLDGIFNPIDPEAVYAGISTEEINITAETGSAELTFTNDCAFELRVKIQDMSDLLTVNGENDFYYYEIVAPGGETVMNFEIDIFNADSTGVLDETFSIVYINNSKYETNDYVWGTDRKEFEIHATGEIGNTIKVSGFPAAWNGASCDIGIEITGAGADQFAWEIVPDETWLEIEPRSGTGSTSILLTAVASDDLQIGNNQMYCEVVTSYGSKRYTLNKEITATGNWLAYIPGLKASNNISLMQSNGNVYITSVHWDSVSQTYSGSYPVDEVDSSGEFSLSLSVPTFSYFYFSGDFESVQSGSGRVRSSDGEYSLTFEKI